LSLLALDLSESCSATESSDLSTGMPAFIRVDI